MYFIPVYGCFLKTCFTKDKCLFNVDDTSRFGSLPLWAWAFAMRTKQDCFVSQARPPRLVLPGSSYKDKSELHACTLAAASKAWSMSAKRSSICSIPMLRRMVEGVMCCCSSSSGDI